MQDAINNTKQFLPDHFATLLGERPAGSQWGRAFTEQDFCLDWREADPGASVRQQGCRYFRLARREFVRAFPDATVAAVRYCDLLTEQRARVYRTAGAHGPELRLDLSATAPADEAWLIVGPHQGNDVVFTVHPGPVMAPDPGHPLDQLDPAAPIAVKLSL